MTTISPLPTAVWRRIEAFPTLVPADPSAPLVPTAGERLRSRLEELLASLMPGEALITQVGLSPGTAVVGVGLSSTVSSDATARLQRALDGLLTLVDDTPRRRLPLQAVLRPTPSQSAAAALVPWPSSGLDTDGLLSLAHRVSGDVTVEVVLRPASFSVDPVTLQRGFERRSRRGPLPDSLDEVRQAASRREQAFWTTVEVTANDVADLDRVRRVFCRGTVVVAEAATAPTERAWVDSLFGGDLVFVSAAAGLIPLTALPADSAAPVARRAALVGATRVADDGDLVLGAGRGGAGVGIPRRDLFQHLAVYGQQGFGKTTTMHGLLREVATAGMPFLVVDPLKLDYLPLLAELSAHHDVAVWRLGSPGSPSVNLLAPPPGIAPQDYAAVFAGAFTQAARLDDFPLASKTLRTSLERVYVRWLATKQPGWPPLAELFDEVQRAGQDADPRSRGAAEVTLSLTARLDALVTGSAGRSLLGGPDAGIEWEQLTSRPTLILLNDMIDPESRNTVFALLMASFLAFRGRNAAPDGHLLVIEEAHALFPGPTGEQDGLLSQQLASALATMRAQRQGFALVTQSPTQLPSLVRERVATRLSLRSDDAGAALLSPTRADVAAQLTGLGVGEVALWSASGDPQAAFLRSPAPSLSNLTLAVPELRGDTSIVPFSDALAATPADTQAARRLGAGVAAKLTSSVDDLSRLLDEAERRTEQALTTVPELATSRVDLARVVLTVALQTKLAHDPVLQSYARELVRSSSLIRTLDKKGQ